MNALIDFISETLILNWFQGNLLLDVFDTYFSAQSDANRVLILIGVLVLAIIGSIQVIKMVVKLSLFWLKIVILIGLVYYLFVILLGIDIWNLI